MEINWENVREVVRQKMGPVPEMSAVSERLKGMLFGKLQRDEFRMTGDRMHLEFVFPLNAYPLREEWDTFTRVVVDRLRVTATTTQHCYDGRHIFNLFLTQLP